MDKIVFKDFPDTTTPIDADNLNLLQDNVEDGINGTILYNNTTGTNGTITLNETSANFKRVVIYFNALGKKHSLVINGNGTWGVTINQSAVFGTYYALRIAGAHFYVEGKTITPSVPAENYTIDLKTNGTFQFFDTVTTLTITKVVGYK